MGNHVAFQQGNMLLEIQNQDRPRIGESEVRQGEVMLGVEGGHLRRSGVHLIRSLNKVSESFINVSRERFVVVRLSVVHVIILIRDMSRIESCRGAESNVSSGILEVDVQSCGRE